MPITWYCSRSYRSEPGRCEIELPHLRAGCVSADATALGLRAVTQGWRSISLDDIVRMIAKSSSWFLGTKREIMEGSAQSGALRRARLASAWTSPPATSRDRGVVNRRVDTKVSQTNILHFYIIALCISDLVLVLEIPFFEYQDGLSFK